MSRGKNVLVFIEQRENIIQNVSLELLGKGKEIATKLGGEVVAALLGNDVENLCETLSHYGADKIVVVEDEALDIYITETYTKALTKVIEVENPDVVLIGATTIGRDLAPRVSARIHTGLTADCTSLDIDEETKLLLMTRPAFGGNIMATIICPDYSPQMSTVRPGVMQKSEINLENQAKIERVNIEFNENDKNIEILEIVKETKKKVNIEDANILVSAGRGIGSKENMESIYSLAETINAEVSGSRAVIDSGWIDKNRQVGQTGKTVRPELYIACGISGAIQHVAGMEDSELIIAINKNPEAAIFNVADLGIVGDINKIIPELVNELERERGKNSNMQEQLSNI